MYVLWFIDSNRRLSNWDVYTTKARDQLVMMTPAVNSTIPKQNNTCTLLAYRYIQQYNDNSTKLTLIRNQAFDFWVDWPEEGWILKFKIPKSIRIINWIEGVRTNRHSATNIVTVLVCMCTQNTTGASTKNV